MDKSNLIWAKSENEGSHWLPLWLHLRDTFQVAGWLWDNRIPTKHRDMLVSDFRMSHNDVKKLYQLLCGLHDLGKSTPDFSGRDFVAKDTSKLFLRMEDAGFSYASYRLYHSGGEAIRHEKASEFFIKDVLFGSGDAPVKPKFEHNAIMSIIAAHHGRPASLNADDIAYLGRLKTNPKDIAWAESITTLAEFILSAFLDSREIIAVAMDKGLTWRSQMIFSGYLSMADWLASSTELFPLWNFSRVEEQSWNLDNTRLEDAIESMGFPSLFEPKKIKLGQSPEELFAGRFGFSTPRPSQNDLVELVLGPDVDPCDIFILEAPMGEGKTEAALIAAEVLMKRSNSTGIFFGMPTMATGEAIYSRFVPYLDSLLSDTNQTGTLELMHSKASISDKRAKVSGRAFYNSSGVGIVDSGWLKGRYLKSLNSFVVGTVDNFLMMQLALKYTYWRHLGFSQKVIIIDEVHSMDETMKHFLSECLRAAGFYNCPVILASATLKESERANYLNFYAQGKELGNKVANVQN